jgi:hypothetical protein
MKFLSFFVVLFLLVSCDRDRLTSYNRIIDNDSSYDVWFISPSFTNSCDFDSVLIPRDTEYILEGFNSAENSNISVFEYENCPSICIDSLNSKISNHDSLHLDITIGATSLNWQYIRGRGNSILGPDGQCDCLLYITDNDIK